MIYSLVETWKEEQICITSENTPLPSCPSSEPRTEQNSPFCNVLVFKTLLGWKSVWHWEGFIFGIAQVLISSAHKTVNGGYSIPVLSLEHRWGVTDSHRDANWGMQGGSLNNHMTGSYLLVSLVAQMVKNLPAMWETWIRSLGQEDHMEEGMATHSSVLA